MDIINVIGAKRNRFGGFGQFLPVDRSTRPEAEEQFRLIEADYQVIDNALVDHLAHLTALDGAAIEPKHLPAASVQPRAQKPQLPAANTGKTA